MHPGLQSWKNLVIYAYNAFSIPLLLKTLFLPWKMDDATGSHFTIFEKVVFYFLSRVIGFVARIILICIGIVFTFLVLLTFPIFFFIPVKISLDYLHSLPSFGASLSYGDTYTLNKHSRDIIGYSAQKMYGKDKALRMIERGLSKDFNHNMLFVGDTGTGKSTLISYLGRLGQSGLSFASISQHRIVELFIENISLPDLDKCLKQAASAGNIILVIENIHAYEAVYERLMPYLQMKHLGIVATTDFTNYDRVLKNHPEFLSKFEKVDLLGTNTEDTLSILRDNARHLKISINEDALLEIVRLTDRLIGNQPQPAKSILVLEELKTLGKTITLEDVQQIISDKTNIPIGAIGKDERDVLKKSGRINEKKNCRTG